MWDELQIAATTDEKAIRRAYAARLRTIDADTDPGAFLRLRSAYERAVAMAARSRNARQKRAPKSQPDAATVVEPPLTAAEPSIVAPQEPTPEQRERMAAHREIDAALQASQPVKALQCLNAAFARGVIRMGEREYALEQVMGAVVNDRSLSGQDYLNVLHEVGWDVVPGSRSIVSPARHAALARADAERWYLDLNRNSRRIYWWWRKPGKGSALLEWRKRAQDASAARLLLGKYRFGFVNPNGMKRVLGIYHHYDKWIGYRFDEKNIGKGEAILNRERWVRPLRKVIIFVISAVTLIVFAAMFGRTGNPGAVFGLIILARFAWAAYKSMRADS